MQLTKTDIIVSHKVLNKVTGELETKDFMQLKTSKNLKGGFNMMYHKSYEEVTESVIKSNTDIKVFNWITNLFTYKQVENLIRISDCPIQISQTQFTRLLKNLVEAGYLFRVSKGVYRLNPFIYIPFRADGSELQEEWNDLTKQKQPTKSWDDII